MRKILDLLSILIASAVHWSSGFILVRLGRAFTSACSDSDMELPVISSAVVNYTATVAPIVIGIMLGLATLVGLSLLMRSEKSRSLLPISLSLSMVVGLLHMGVVGLGVVLPLTKPIYTVAE